MTTMAAQAVNSDKSTDFTGELIDEKIPKATPVFRTYVMLKNPSITEIDSLRSNRFLIRALVQRSTISVTATNRTYGSRPWSFNDMFMRIVDYIRGAGQRTTPYGILSEHFSTEV